MSTLKVDAIRHNSATSDAITTASDGTCTAKLTSVGGGQLSHRNLIINGAMLVAQRGTSMATGDGFAADRFRLEINGTDENPTLTQADVASGTTPYTLGFRKSWKVQNGNQTSGAGATDRIQMQYRFEAQDIANSGWNYTSSSSFVTLSLWVKSSVAQTFYGLLFTLDGTSQNYPFETGSLSADTWTKITKTIPGNSNLTFNNDNGEGIKFELHMLRGTDYTASGVTLNQWAAYSSSARTPDQTTTWYTTNDATFEITGVQLEVGDTATTFEHRSFTEELTRCYRYYRRFGANGALPTPGAYNRFSIGYSPSSADVRFPFQLDPPMRINPVNSNFSKSGSFAIQPGSIGSYSLTCDDNSCSPNMMIALMGSTSVSSGTGSAVSLHANNDTSAYIEISAEL